MKYVLNQETDRIELHFERLQWVALPEEKKKEVKSAFLWSNYGKCWVSRSTRNHWRALAVVRSLGLEDGGTVGEVTTFAEKLEAKQDRAADRADRAEERATKARQEADARFNSSNIETLRGMQGEPVKLSHHSAKRHLSLIDRADNDMRKGCEALDKAKHYDHRAGAAANTADAPELRNRAFLDRRIVECETEIRRLTPCLERGSSDYKAGMLRYIREAEDKLAFYREKLDALGGIPHSPETIRVGMLIKRRGSWFKVTRINRLTVSIVCLESHNLGWKWKCRYAEIQEVRDGESTAS